MKAESYYKSGYRLAMWVRPQIRGFGFYVNPVIPDSHTTIILPSRFSKRKRKYIRKGFRDGVLATRDYMLNNRDWQLAVAASYFRLNIKKPPAETYLLRNGVIRLVP